MNVSIIEPGKCLDKAQFQEELNKWFENRGIIQEMRSHLRHLMISALQNTQIGPKPTENVSPKTQALNMIIAEYLIRHKCHYTLSIFTSEVPTLTGFSCISSSNFLRKGKPSTDQTQDYRFQENELEEIFNALGLISCVEELQRTKATYFKETNEISLVELIIEAVFEMATKLKIRQNFESYQVDEGRRLLSEKWSLRIVNILLNEKIKPPVVTAVQEAIFRITENEMRRIIGEERSLQMKILAEREKRIQEYLKRHEDEILFRLMEAEKNLEMRTDLIDEDLTERQKHLYKLAVEWSNKHEEIVKLSKNIYNTEKENKKLQEKIDELERENKKLRNDREKQNETIDDLRTEINSLIGRLKEVTESNVILSERVEVLINRENKEVSINHDDAKQNMANIPLLWSKFNEFTRENIKEDKSENHQKNRQSAIKVQYYDNRNGTDFSNNLGDFDENEKDKQITLINSFEDEISVNSTSSDEVLWTIRQKLQKLEEESNRLNDNYLQYKLKSQPFESDSDLSSSSSVRSEKTIESPSKAEHLFSIKETKFCQTDRESKANRIKNVEERLKKQTVIIQNVIQKSSESPPKMSEKEPTKRQLKNREFFLKSREMLQEFEKQKNQEIQITSPSLIESSDQILTTGSLDLTPEQSESKKINKSPKNSISTTPLKKTSFYCDGIEEEKKKSPEKPSPTVKLKSNCLALLEETRIKSPREESQKKSLRQQILLAELAEENDEEEKVPNQSENQKRTKSTSSKVSSPVGSVSSEKISLGKAKVSDLFW